MKPIRYIAIILMLSPFCPPSTATQSLAELARKEVARRRLLREQGILGKVITGESLERSRSIGNLSTFSTKVALPGKTSQPKGSVQPFRSKLKKLDAEIRRTEDRIRLLESRMEAERRSRDNTIRTGRVAAGSSGEDRLRWQILEAEAKLEQLKEDRAETYRDGRKAGFLPGELEGRGIVP